MKPAVFRTGIVGVGGDHGVQTAPAGKSEKVIAVGSTREFPGIPGVVEAHVVVRWVKPLRVIPG